MSEWPKVGERVRLSDGREALVGGGARTLTFSGQRMLTLRCDDGTWADVLVASVELAA